ncbi:hydrolase, partial [Streptomyces sp. SID11233]|nr:hydrolase [Streptomyces sp. SID11233]
MSPLPSSTSHAVPGTASRPARRRRLLLAAALGAGLVGSALTALPAQAAGEPVTVQYR